MKDDANWCEKPKCTVRARTYCIYAFQSGLHIARPQENGAGVRFWGGGGGRFCLLGACDGAQAQQRNETGLQIQYSFWGAKCTRDVQDTRTGVFGICTGFQSGSDVSSLRLSCRPAGCHVQRCIETQKPRRLWTQKRRCRGMARAPAWPPPISQCNLCRTPACLFPAQSSGP